MSKKILSFLLCAALVFALAVPASAASTADIEAYNQKVVQKARELEAKYNLTISWPTRQSGYYAIGTVTLGMLDASLEMISAELIRELSDFFLDYKGRKIAVEYVFPPQGYDAYTGTQLASFTEDLSLLQIYIPQYDGQMVISGNSPGAIVHEMGHAFHTLAEQRHGVVNLRSQWLGYNGNHSYNPYQMRSPSNTVFFSDYAATDYYEDFAETFAAAFTSNRAGLGIAPRLTSNGNRTGLGSKINFLQTLVSTHMTNSEKALQNIQKIYNTATHINFNGYNLSGSTLEYIGFSEPNGVVAGVLKANRIEASSYEWKREVGGWYIVDKGGSTWLAFPGGECITFPALSNAA